MKSPNVFPIPDPLDSPPPSPLEGRRPPLSAMTDAELRLACASLMHNQKPSHLYVEDPAANKQKPMLDYAAIKRSTRPDQNAFSTNRRNSARVFSAEDDFPIISEPVDSKKYAYKPDTALKDLFPEGDTTHELVQADVARRTEDVSAIERTSTRPSSGRPVSQAVSVNVSVPTSDHNPQPKVGRRGNSQDTADSTSFTDCTEYPWSTSTAATSAHMTPAHASNRLSILGQTHAEQDPALRPDPQAVAWMRQALEKRRREQDAAAQVAVEAATLSPPRTSPQTGLSRKPSFASQIKDYIRPSTSGQIRPVSRDTSRPPSRAASTHSTRSGFSTNLLSRRPSANGWRSWTKSRKDSAHPESNEVESNRGRSDNQGETGRGRKSVNLNRELPPLPGLDQWKPVESEKPRHIASLWNSSSASKNRSHTEPPQQTMWAVQPESEQSKDKEDIIAARLGTPKDSVNVDKTQPKDIAVPRKQVPNTKSPAADSVLDDHFDNLVPTNTIASSKRDRSRAAESVTPPPALNRLKTAPAAESASMESKSSSLGRKFSLSQSRGGDRKRPSDLNPRSPATTDASASGASNIARSESRAGKGGVRSVTSPRPSVPTKDEKKAWWNFKIKSKKSTTWTEQMEKLAIKDDVLADEGAASPVIRF